jgi:hypothetical protein
MHTVDGLDYSSWRQAPQIPAEIAKHVENIVFPERMQRHGQKERALR